MTFGGMHDNARLLVDNQKVVVLVNRVDGNILCRKIAFFLRQFDGKDVALFWRNPASDFFAVEKDKVLKFQLCQKAGGEAEFAPQQGFNGHAFVFFCDSVLKFTHRNLLFTFVQKS